MSVNLQLCIDGDDVARSQFWIEYEPIIYAAVNFRLMRTRFAQDAQDVVHDIYIELFDNDAVVLRTYDPRKASLETFIATVAGNTARDYLRKSRRLASKEVAVGGTGELEEIARKHQWSQSDEMQEM